MKPLFANVCVNGETIPAELIASEAQNHPAPMGKPGHAWQAAARALAMRVLLLQEARRRDLTPDPQELNPGQIETPEEALIRQLLQEAVQPQPPSDAELRRVYSASPDRFRAPSLYEAAHILFPARPDDGPGRRTARASAEAVLAQVRLDPHSFARLARDHSACPSRTSGGILGQLTAGDTVPEFDSALALMPEGSLSETPVETRFGFHIIRLDARARGAVLPFASVEAQLRVAQEKAAWVRDARAFVQGLADGADVTGVTLRAA